MTVEVDATMFTRFNFTGELMFTFRQWCQHRSVQNFVYRDILFQNILTEYDHLFLFHLILAFKYFLTFTMHC